MEFEYVEDLLHENYVQLKEEEEEEFNLFKNSTNQY
jgi:hypothetical protein